MFDFEGDWGDSSLVEVTFEAILFGKWYIMAQMIRKYSSAEVYFECHETWEIFHIFSFLFLKQYIKHHDK